MAPTKIIGRTLTAEEAEIEEAKGNHTVQVEGGYRRIVAAPKPIEIVEIDAIKALCDADQVVIAAGGGGMAAGEAVLALAGPIGWAIAAASLVACGLLIWKKIVDKNHLTDIFTLISERDIKSYDLAIVEINERIARIDDETGKLHKATDRINSFGLDYNNMTEAQQYELGAYVNLMSSATQLLVNPIIGIQPKYTEEDYNEYLSWREEPLKESEDDNTKKLVVCLCNLLYKIDLNERDKKLLRKSVKKNKDWLKQLDIKKKDVKSDLIDVVMDALNHKYDICE